MSFCSSWDIADPVAVMNIPMGEQGARLRGIEEGTLFWVFLEKNDRSGLYFFLAGEVEAIVLGFRLG